MCLTIAVYQRGYQLCLSFVNDCALYWEVTPRDVEAPIPSTVDTVTEFFPITGRLRLTSSNSNTIVGRGGTLVDSSPFVRGFESLASRHVETLDKSFPRCCMWRFGVKLRHSIHAVSGAPLSTCSSGLEEAL